MQCASGVKLLQNHKRLIYISFLYGQKWHVACDILRELWSE